MFAEQSQADKLPTTLIRITRAMSSYNSCKWKIKASLCLVRIQSSPQPTDEFPGIFSTVFLSFCLRHYIRRLQAFANPRYLKLRKKRLLYSILHLFPPFHRIYCHRRWQFSFPIFLTKTLVIALNSRLRIARCTRFANETNCTKYISELWLERVGTMETRRLRRSCHRQDERQTAFKAAIIRRS